MKTRIKKVTRENSTCYYVEVKGIYKFPTFSPIAKVLSILWRVIILWVDQLFYFPVEDVYGYTIQFDTIDEAKKFIDELWEEHNKKWKKPYKKVEYIDYP